MKTMLIKSTTMKNIAQAIRDKMYNNANNETFYPNQMADLINNLYDWNTEFAYGIEPSNEEYQFWCGEYVTSMKQAFERQYYRDSPVVCGNNVIDYSYAYYRCEGLTNSFNVGPNVNNMSHTFDGCRNVWNIPVTTRDVKDMSYTYANCYGAIVNWYNSNESTVYRYDPTLPKCYADPVCGERVNNFQGAYKNCWRLEGNPVCNENVIDMSYTYYNCFSLIGNPVCGNNVNNMHYTYYGCWNLNGSPVCANNVNEMFYTYAECYNLTGNVVCGESVTNMAHAYENCWNLNGYVIIGDKVRNMANAFTNCYNILNTDCESQVNDLNYAYWHCYNAEGVGIIGQNVRTAIRAYDGCIKLTGALILSNYIGKGTKSGYIYSNCFNLRTVNISNTVRPEWSEQYSEYQNFPSVCFHNCISIKNAVPFYSGYFCDAMYNASYYICGNLFEGSRQPGNIYKHEEHVRFMNRINLYNNEFDPIIENFNEQNIQLTSDVELLNFYTCKSGLIDKFFIYENSARVFSLPNSICIPGTAVNVSYDAFTVELEPTCVMENSGLYSYTDAIIFFPYHNLRYYYSSNYSYSQFY